MSERRHRTEILLEPEQHRRLSEIARREGRSISDIVREMIDRGLDEQAEAKQAEIDHYMEVLERIRRHREAILERRGGKPLDFDVVEEINRGRDERDEQIWNNVFGRR